MKYKGKKLEGRNTDILVLQKGNEQIIFKAEAVMNFKEFDKLCPAPKPPIILKPGNRRIPNENDSNYLKAMEKYGEQRINYMIIKSLEATEDLEWDNVNINNPDTYENWQKELEEAGFSETERMRIMVLCTQVNALDDNMLDQAKETFLAEAPQQGK